MDPMTAAEIVAILTEIAASEELKAALALMDDDDLDSLETISAAAFDESDKRTQANIRHLLGR